MLLIEQTHEWTEEVEEAETTPTHRTAEELSMADQKHSPLDLHPFLVLCNVYLQFLQWKGGV